MVGTVCASWVRLHELCLRHLNSLGIVCHTDHACGTCSILPSEGIDLSVCVLPQWNSESFEPLGPLAAKHCLSHRRLWSHNDRHVTAAESVKFHPCPVDTCVEDETVDSLGASAVRSLILFGAHRYACVTSYASVVISGSLR